MTANTPTFNAGRAWLVTAISIICSICIAFVTFKAMTAAPYMMAYFQVDIGTYGAITSSVGLLTIVGSIPVGFLLAKMGPRRLMIMVLAGCAISGYLQIACVGAGFMVFMWLGGIAGFFYGMWAACGPMLVTAWFPAEQRGMPNSISTIWISLAMMIILNISAPLFAMAGGTPENPEPIGFLNIFWLMSILLTICVVLCIFFVRMPKPENSFLEAVPEGGEQKKSKFTDGFKNLGTWMLLLIFLAYGFVTASYGNYFPTYLTAPVVSDDPLVAGGGLGMDFLAANSMSSITTYVMIAVNIIWGFVLVKIPNRRYNFLVIIMAAGLGILSLFMFSMPSEGFIPTWQILYGVFSQLFPPVCFAMLPEMANSPDELSASIGIVVFISMVAGTATAITIGAVTAAGGWGACFWVMLVLLVIAVLAAVILLPFYRKKFNERHGAATVAA